MKENEGRVPEREMLDFVYQMELLARKTHLILAEEPRVSAYRNNNIRHR